MIRGRDIDRLVELLEDRKVKLYHACQLKDFESYLEVGGLPSRALLERRRLPFTAFETDKQDRDNGVWDAVFLNLEDLGGIFERACSKGKANSVPNPFGPVLFVLYPEALRQATDVAISLRSAGAVGFDRERDALSLSDVPQIFLDRTNLVKFSDKLREEFKRDYYISAPEVSCTFSEGMIDWEHVYLIRVDPYEFRKKALSDYVKHAVEHAGLDLRVYERRGRNRLYQDLWDALRAGGDRDLKVLVHDENCSDELLKWAEEFATRGPRLTRQWPRYAKYLFKGTISLLEARRDPVAERMNKAVEAFRTDMGVPKDER